MKSSPRSPQLEKARMQQRRPNTAKKKKKSLKKEISQQPSLSAQSPFFLNHLIDDIFEIWWRFSASHLLNKKYIAADFPGGTVVKNPPANAGTQVRALVWEDPTCRGATKSMHHNY